MSDSYLTRRHFFAALAASVVAAGVPLPIGFPVEPKKIILTKVMQWEVTISFVDVDESGRGTFKAVWKDA